MTVKVADSSTPKAQTASQSLTLAVNAPPGVSIPSFTLPPGVAGTSYSQSLIAVGGVAPYTWTLTSGTLPGGVSLTSSPGIISGTPTSVGTFDLTFKVSDDEAPTPQSASIALVLSILAPAPLNIVTTTLDGGTQGGNYDEVIEATGGVAPYTWNLTAGSLPTGLSLDQSGNISGIPLAYGTFTFTISVADSSTPAAQSVSSSFSITI